MGFARLSDLNGLVNNCEVDKWGNYRLDVFVQPSYPSGEKKGQPMGAGFKMNITFPQPSDRMKGDWRSMIEDQFRVLGQIPLGKVEFVDGRPSRTVPIFIRNGLQMTQDKWDYDGKTYTKFSLRAAPWTKVSLEPLPKRGSDNGSSSGSLTSADAPVEDDI